MSRRSMRAAQVRGQPTAHAGRNREQAAITLPTGVSSYSISSRWAVSGQVTSRYMEVSPVQRPGQAKPLQGLQRRDDSRSECANAVGGRQQVRDSSGIAGALLWSALSPPVGIGVGRPLELTQVVAKVGTVPGLERDEDHAR